MSDKPDTARATTDVSPEWIDPHLPTVFSKWHKQTEALQAATISAVINAAGIQPGQRVVDIGSGSGIPALKIAELAGPGGMVYATDPSPLFVEALLMNARERGLTNIDTTCCSVASMPFSPAQFDAATSHMSSMFFFDVQSGLQNIRLVLKPGARAGLVAWGSDEQNQFFGSFWAAAGPHLLSASVDQPPQPEDHPSPSRFAATGRLAAELTAADFNDVNEETRIVELIWPGEPASLMQLWLEISRVADTMPSEQRVALERDVLSSYEQFRGNKGLHFRVTIVVASGSA